MTFQIKNLIVFIFVFIVIHSYGQDKILFINGTEDFGRVVENINDKITVEFTDKNGKTKLKKYDKEDIFSITYAKDNREDVLYRQDSLSQENYFSEDDMRAYIAGEKDAMLTYKTPLAIASSFAIGAASGYFVPVILTPVIPAAWVILNGSRWIKIKRKDVSDKKYLKEDMYIVGYGRTARSIRVQNSLKSAGLGLAAGIAGQLLVGYIRSQSK